jgi:hypothetical protein
MLALAGIAALSADAEMIRRPPIQQYHCSLCAALFPQGERLWVQFAPRNVGAEGSLLDHLVGALLEERRHRDPERLGSLKIDDELIFHWRLDGKFARSIDDTARGRSVLVTA